jgi:hypothetical protein
MSISSTPPSAKPLTAVFMKTANPSIDESQILKCPCCAKATVPVPDPQRPPSVSHCYWCSAEFDVSRCSGCAAAILIGPEGGADVDPFRCADCGGA